MRTIVAFSLLICFTVALGLEAQQLNPKLAAASQLMRQSNYAAAEKTLSQRLAEEPTDNQAWNMLGVCQSAQKQFAKSIKSFEKAAASPQLAAAARYNMACAQAQLGQVDQSMVSLEKAFNAGFNNVDLLANDPDLASLRSNQVFQAFLAARRKMEKVFAEKDSRIVHRWLGEAAGDEFGWVARVVGDCDGDGVLDFVATAPSHKQGAGKIYVYSGKTAKLLFEKTGKPGERLGNGAASAGDVNNDGVPDVLVGAPNWRNKSGAAYVYSGRDGKQLLELAGRNDGDQFGYKVSPLFDIDGDGHDDIFVGAIGEAGNTGAGYAHSGKTGDRLFKLTGEASGHNFGSAAAAIRDKQTTWLAVGAQNSGKGKRGGAYVYRVEKSRPNLAFQIKSGPNNVNLGMMFVSFPGDLNGDGTPDVYASDWQAAGPNLPGAGQIVVHSGADGKRILELFGLQRGEGFGTSPSDAGDVNGDGAGDLIVGAWQNRAGARSGGRVSLHDGKTGRLLDSWTCVQAGDTFGFDAVGIGDVDGDGNIDFLLTSAWANIHGPKTGRVFIVAGKKYSAVED